MMRNHWWLAIQAPGRLDGRQRRSCVLLESFGAVDLAKNTHLLVGRVDRIKPEKGGEKGDCGNGVEEKPAASV